MEREEQTDVKKIPWLGIIVILCGLLVFWLIGSKYIIGVFNKRSLNDKSSMYEGQLKSRLSGATLIKVTSVVSGRNTVASSFEEKEKETIQNIIESIEIAPFGYGDSCECEGNQYLEFYKGESLCARLTFHHGKSFRWDEGWPSDMELTRKSARYIKKWMIRSGVKHFD